MINLLNEIKDCRKCETIIGHKKFPIESHGNLESFAMLVSEAPGKDSLDKKKYWVGSGGKILRECLPYKTQFEDLFYLTDIVKCWPNENGENRKPSDSEILNCSPFLIMEIERIKPKLIVSFGATSSSFLLNRDVKITKEHGRVSQYNENTKIITLLHPSGIDRFMDRRIYKIQIALLFSKIKEKDLNNIYEVFGKKNETEHSFTNKEKHNIPQNKFIQTKKGSFTIPTPGNSITEHDVNKNQIRITADFKDFFPTQSSIILIKYRNEHFKVKFNYRFNKSHILRLGNELASRINLRAGMSIKMTFLDKTRFRIE
jgi:DNA polymerase